MNWRGDLFVNEPEACPRHVTSEAFPYRAPSIHDHVSQTGSNRVAVHSKWTATVSWRGLKPSQAPIIAQFSVHSWCRGRRERLRQARLADHSSSGYSSDKAWSSLLLIAATSTPTGMCSFTLNLTQTAVQSSHHHGRCGVSESFVQKRSPRPRRRPRAANWQANGGGERDHDVVRASSEFGMQRGP